MAAKHIETLRDDWLEEIRPSLSPKTRKGYRATTDLLIRYMGDRGLSVEQLDEAALVRFRNWRLETPKPDGSKRSEDTARSYVQRRRY